MIKDKGILSMYVLGTILHLPYLIHTTANEIDVVILIL